MVRRTATDGPRRRRTGGPPMRGLLPLAVLLLLWQLLGSDDSLSFPPPSTWISSLRDLQADDALLPALGKTTRTFVLALAFGSAVGAAIGIAIGTSRRADRALGPMLEFLRTLPAPAVVPIATLLLGLNVGTAIVVVAFASMWPVLLNTAAAMQAIPTVRMEMSRTLGLTRLQRLRQVVLPSLAPGIALGVRIAAPICLIVTLVVEILASTGGAGTLLREGQSNFNSPQAYGVLLVIGVLGLAVSSAIAVAENAALRNWPPSARG